MTTTRTNLGPLTTAFSYPASCTVNVIQCSYCLVAWQAQTCSNNPDNAQGVQDNVGCWPPRTTGGDITTGVAVNGWGVYSPGLSCPIGYNTACSATGTTVGGFQFQFPISAQETGVGCCPPNYTCQWAGPGAAQTCYSVATTGSFSAVQCSSGTSNAFSYYTVPSVATVTTTGTSTASGSGSASTVTSTGVALYNFNTVTLLAPMFQLVHQASDVPLTSSGTKNAGNSGTSPANTGTQSSSAENTGLSSSSSSGLSTGAVAGIAVGSVVVGLALIGAFIYLFLKQRKQKNIIAQYAPPPNMSGNMGMPPDMSNMSNMNNMNGMNNMSNINNMNHMNVGPSTAQSMPDGSYFNGSTPLPMKSMPSPVYEVAVESPRHELA